MKVRTNEKELPDDEKETGRLEAFSDGVFAVAITLLALNFKIPQIDPGKPLLADDVIRDLMFNQLSNFGAFVISFFTIGIMWLNHHKIFKHIKRIDTGLIVLNIILLLIIVFIPVPTALLAEYLFDTDNTHHAAAIFYSSTFFLMAFFFNILWRYAAHNGRLLGKNVSMKEVKKIDQQYMFGPILYVFAIILAFFNTPASAIFQLLLALFFALPGKRNAPEEALPTHTSEEIEVE